MPQQQRDEWVTVNPTQQQDEWETINPPEPSWYESAWDTAAGYIPQPVKSAWDALWSPLSDLPSRAASVISEPLMQYGESGTDWTRTPALYGGAFAQSVGDVLSGLTSLGNIGLAAATGGAGLVGRAGVQQALPVVAPMAARGLTTVGRTLGGATAAHGAQAIADPSTTMFEKGLGAIEAVGGGLAARGTRVPSKAAAIPEELPVRPSITPIEPAAVTPEALPVRAPEVPVAKPKIRANPDGTFTDTSTGKIFDRAGNPVKPFDPTTLQGLEPAPPAGTMQWTGNRRGAGTGRPEMQFVDPNTFEVRTASQAKPGDVPLIPEAPITPEVVGRTVPKTPSTAAETAPRLPKDLQSAKPRFNIGADSYFPQFQDDLDKALYIIAQKTKSKRDADYLKYVMEQTGLDEVAARNAGAQIRAAIKKAVAGKETGDVDIPPIMRERLASETGPTQTPKEFLEGKPQISTGPIVPENVRPAADVAASLSQRLRKAVDEAGTPNAVAAEDISKLMDEAAEIINKMPDGPEKHGLIREVLGANKALLTSWDVSAPGRQGKAFIFNKAWWTSLDDMVKAWGSKAAADNIQQSIIEHPSGYFRQPISETGKVGKSFAEQVGLDLASTEEMFNKTFGRAFEKYSLVGKSSRAHTAFLNKLRSDQFVSMMNAAKKAGLDPENNLQIAKAYAKFINDGTGRGSVNIGKWKLERNLGVLNDVFFAPKNMSGQIRTWNAVLNPVKYYNYDPVLRKQALRSLFAVAGMGLGVGEIARLAGADVSLNPTSSDFLKIRVKNTRYDPFGGYQQFPVAAVKLILGTSTPTTKTGEGKPIDLMAGKYGQETRGSVAQRFFTNRLSPVGSFIWAWMFNREFDGKPFEVKRALYERVFPIAAKDIYELAQEDPEIAILLGPATLMGLVGTQTYTGR